MSLLSTPYPFLAPILLLYTSGLYSQQSEPIDIGKAYDFINSTIKTDKTAFNLADQPYFGVFGVDTSDIFSDVLFDDADRVSLRAQFEQMDKITWDANNINGAVVLPQKDISKVFKHKNGWKRFRKKYGNCLTSYSLPLFTSDYDYCIFYEWTQCDYLMGGGSINLYTYKNGNWTYVKSYMRGIS